MKKLWKQKSRHGIHRAEFNMKLYKSVVKCIKQDAKDFDISPCRVASELISFFYGYDPETGKRLRK